MRKGELIANLFVFPGLTFVAIFSAVLLRDFSDKPERYLTLPVALWVVGFSFFLKAKWSRIRQGELTEFGFAKMTHINKRLYIGGYAIMFLGCLAACV